MNDQNFYIKLENGEPVDFPISEQNLKMTYPELDPTNPPEGFARVIRERIPESNDPQIFETVSYELNEYYTRINNTKTYSEVYRLSNFIPETSSEEIENHRKARPDQENWIYDEKIKSLIPPVPKPDNYENYVWSFPDELNGETEGKWVKQVDVMKSPTLEEIDAIVENMKKYGKENNVPEETIQSLIDNFRKTAIVNNNPV
jgi:hypothetical protein